MVKRNKFGLFKNVNRKSDGSITTLKTSKGLEGLMNEAEDLFIKMMNKGDSLKDFELVYGLSSDKVNKIDYNNVDINQFSSRMRDFVHFEDVYSYGGLFISALINNREDHQKPVFIDTIGMHDLMGLCYQHHNGKTIIQDGIGSSSCRDMSGGEVVVEGDCLGALGWNMCGGDVYLKGHVITAWMAHDMTGGRIHIEKWSENIEYLKNDSQRPINGEIWYQGHRYI